MRGEGVDDGDRPGTVLAAAMDRLLGVSPDAIPAALAGVAEDIGFSELTMYMADLQQTVLLPWDGPRREVEGVAGTPAGRAFQRGEPVHAADGVWWIPVTDSGDRLGVIRLAAPGADAGTVVADGLRLAALVGLVITSRRLRGDNPILACRSEDVSLAAELRWALMPPRSLVTGDVSVSGHLEPAYEIAGDTFDYALNGRQLHVAVFDAMGHGMAASRLANLAVGSYRNSRRRGRDLRGIYLDMDRAVAAEFGEEFFVTANLAQLDLDTGMLSVVNAGHPPPELIRGGKAHKMEFAPATPIGLGFVTAEVGEVRLEPGDSVIIVSDGVTEARSAGGDLFTVERVGDLAVRALAGGETVPETVRRLILDLLEHRATGLEDDATLLLLQWRPGH